MQASAPFEFYNELQQFKELFHSLSYADREEPAEDFDLDGFLDESWAD